MKTKKPSEILSKKNIPTMKKEIRAFCKKGRIIATYQVDFMDYGVTFIVDMGRSYKFFYWVLDEPFWQTEVEVRKV